MTRAPRWDRISAAVREALAPSRTAIVRGRAASTAMSATMRPGRGDITTTRSATRIASGMLWVTRITSCGRALAEASSSRSKRSRVRASSALNGSSSRSTSGSSASARASATRWRVPPESSAGRAIRAGGVEADQLGELEQPPIAPFRRPAGELERVGDVVGRRSATAAAAAPGRPARSRGFGPVIGRTVQGRPSRGPGSAARR